MQQTTQRPATKFTMRGLQLLSSGTVTEKLVVGDHLWLMSKVYSRGGENSFHSHQDEDHAFFVLQGSVVFSFGDGSSHRAERFEGVNIPKGTLYRFETEGGDDTIMLRMGGYAVAPDSHSTLDADGKPLLDDRAPSRGKTPSEPIVALPGAFFES